MIRAPSYIERPKLAAPHVAVGERVLAGRRMSCIAAADGCDGAGVSLSYSTSRGYVVEHVACGRCSRTWKRHNP